MARIPEAEVQRLKEEVAVQRFVEAAGIEVWRIEFPKDMDANEYALKVTPAVPIWGACC